MLRLYLFWNADTTYMSRCSFLCSLGFHDLYEPSNVFIAEIFFADVEEYSEEKIMCKVIKGLVKFEFIEFIKWWTKCQAPRQKFELIDC